MATQKFKLFEADIDVDGVLKRSADLKKAIEDTRVAQVKAKFEFGEASEEYVKQEAILKKLRREYNLNQKQVQNLTDTNGNLLTVQQKLDKALKQEVKSVKSAIANNKELRQLRNEIDVTTREGAEAVEQLNKKIDENTDLIKENSSALEKLKLNVGNYKEDIKGAFNELNIFNGGLTGFIERSQKAGGASKLLSQSFKTLRTGIIGLTKSTVAFMLTPIGAFLTILIGLFLLIKNAFNQGGESVNRLKNAFSAFSGILRAVLKFIKPLGDFLIDGLAAGLEIAEIAIYKTLEAFEALLRFVGLDGLADTVGDFKEELESTAKASRALAIAERQLAKEQRKSQLIQLQYQKDAEKLRQIRDNENLSIRERIQANEELGAVLQEQLQEELKIAELALEVANLRIEAEGKTKEALDEQAEALVAIADIQERITGQESEQLTNRVALQKEAADKARELADKAIAEQEAQLKLFLEQQGVRKKSYEEQLSIIEETYRRELEILEANLKNRNLTETEAEAERLRLLNQKLNDRNDLITEQAHRELDIYIQNHKSKIDAELFFSDESLRIEQERLDGILEKQKEFYDQQLELGKINQQEYNDEINRINEENRIAVEEAEKLRDEARKEKEIIDLENKREIDEAKFKDDFDLQLTRLEQQRLAEIENAKKTGADIELINKKFAVAEVAIKKQAELNKLELTANIFGQIQGLLKEGTAVSKILGIAQATIDTYIGANKALATLPPPFGAIQAGVTITTGLGNVAKISGVKFEKGGVIDIGGKRHSAGGTKFFGEDGTAFEAEKGEKMFILNRRASVALQPLLSHINESYGGIPLSKSSTYLQAGGEVLRSSANRNINITSMEASIEKAVASGSEIGSMRGSMQGALEGSRIGSAQGTRQGSAEGTYSGIVDRIENEIIERGADF